MLPLAWLRRNLYVLFYIIAKQLTATGPKDAVNCLANPNLDLKKKLYAVRFS